mmetsp:Transcript_43215/g.97674  ORF Transcript_43215/g.97674 Transcript_43215/m.97674 type:complete len:212 (-) Transcript_43215:268-903(-)
MKCRSVMAGWSGVLYALPGIVNEIPPVERGLWFLQGFLSVWADYYEIHHLSFAHGLDRLFATFMTIRMIALCVLRLRSGVALFALVPLGCFSRSAAAKIRGDLDGWKFWHFWWHFTGSSISVVVLWIMTECAGGSQDESALGRKYSYAACQSNTQMVDPDLLTSPSSNLYLSALLVVLFCLAFLCFQISVTFLAVTRLFVPFFAKAVPKSD